MKAFFIALCSFVLVLSCSGCGGSSDDGPSLSQDACSTLGLNARIIDGTACTENNSPIVRLRLIGSDGSEGLCSGAMLTSNDVLTAAHCFFLPVTQVIVESGSQTSYGRTVRLHPEVRTESETQAVFNDVALLELTSPLSTPTLPLLGSRAVGSNDVISIFGYGLDENGEAGTLRSGEMKIRNVSANHVFARFDGAGSNTCNGDSGGPAIFTFNDTDGNPVDTIVGVVSSGELITCESGDVTLFANTGTDPINSFILSNVPDAQIR